MCTSWEGEEPDDRGWTRREWARLAIAAGAAGSLAAMTGTVTGQLLPPPVKFSGEMREEMYYTKWPTSAWWNSGQGRVMRVTDFEEWQGATGVWRGLFLHGQWVPGTGYPILVIRLKYDAPEFVVSTDLAPPEGFSFVFDDPDRQVRIVAVFDRCTHLCCFPGWHMLPVAERNYRVTSPIHSVYGQDPIFCVCHGSPVRPAPPHDECAPEERRAVSRSDARARAN
jgi:hypothetical protein